MNTPNPSGKGRPLVDVPLTNVLGLVADAQVLTEHTKPMPKAWAL